MKHRDHNDRGLSTTVGEAMKALAAEGVDGFRAVVDAYMAPSPSFSDNELVAALRDAAGEARAMTAFFVLAVRLHRLALQDRGNSDAGTSETPLGLRSAAEREEREILSLFESFKREGLTQIIAQYYGFEADGVRELDFKLVGTTSVILMDPNDSGSIYKCILPRYMCVDEIRNSASEYSARVERLRSHPRLRERIPYMHAAYTDRYLKQQYLVGPTLQEYLSHHRAWLHHPDQHQQLRLVAERVATGLCQVLEYVGAFGEMHLDLAPSNIIIKHCTGWEFEAEAVCVVDFGRNFLLTAERVGMYTAYEAAAMYVADEIKRGMPQGHQTSDAYSVGMILLDILTDHGEERPQGILTWVGNRVWRALRGQRTPIVPRRHGGLAPRTVNEDLGRLWRDAPQLAALVEDATERNPRSRLLSVPSDGLARQFSALRSLIRHKIAVDALVPGPREHDEAMHPGRALRIGLSGFALDGVYDLLRIRALAARDSARLPPEVERTEGVLALALFAAVVAAEWLVVLTMALLFQLADFWAAAPGRGTVASVASALPGNHFRLGDWRENLGGRLTALTFSFIAARYYLNIFSALPFTAIPRHFGRIRRGVVRATGTASPLICVIGILYPTYWLLLGGVGSIFIVWNNVNMWQLSREALGIIKYGRAELDDRAAGLLDEFQRDFKEWWVLFGAYGAALGLLGGIQLLGWYTVKDELVLAALVVGTNYMKLYRNNCRDRAPGVRGNLARSIDILRRSDLIPALSPWARIQRDPSVIGLPRVPMRTRQVPGAPEMEVLTDAEGLYVVGVPPTTGFLHPATVLDIALSDGQAGAKAIFVDDARSWLERSELVRRHQTEIDFVVLQPSVEWWRDHLVRYPSAVGLPSNTSFWIVNSDVSAMLFCARVADQPLRLLVVQGEGSSAEAHEIETIRAQLSAQGEKLEVCYYEQESLRKKLRDLGASTIAGDR